MNLRGMVNRYSSVLQNLQREKALLFVRQSRFVCFMCYFLSRDKILVLRNVNLICLPPVPTSNCYNLGGMATYVVQSDAKNVPSCYIWIQKKFFLPGTNLHSVTCNFYAWPQTHKWRPFQLRFEKLLHRVCIQNRFINFPPQSWLKPNLNDSISAISPTPF